MKIAEIAKIAGVSKTTVSRALNNKSDVNEKTRLRIQKVAEENNYKPNALAKAIALNKSQSIGMIIPYNAEYIFSNQYYVEVMRGIYTEADKRGYSLLICYPHDHNYVDMFAQKQVEGYVVISPGSDHTYILQSLVDAKAPFVSTSDVIDWNNPMNVVDIDNYKGGRMLTDYLYNLGHRNIAYIGKKSISSSVNRLRGYKDVLEEKGVAYCDSLVRVIEDATVANAEEATLALLKKNPNLTAIFAASDMLAIGAIKAIKALGKKVPDDISVVGFDDIPFASYYDPPLTTIKQPAFEKGVEAVKMLVNMLENETDAAKEVILMSISLVERKSASSPN